MIGAIVLAAGRSQRMGTQKLLLRLGGRPLIANVVDAVQQSQVDEIVVVVRQDDERIKAVLAQAMENATHVRSPQTTESVTAMASGNKKMAIAKRAEARAPVRFVVNPDAEGEMLSSVRCGLRALPTELEAVLVVLGDQPGVSCGLIQAMLREFRVRGSGLVVPQHAGRRGHPLLFAAPFREEIMTRHDGIGLKGLLAAHPGEICELEVASPTDLADLDTPEDYERWQAPLAG